MPLLAVTFRHLKAVVQPRDTAPPAVINAFLVALRTLGVDHIDMSATPLRVWESLRRAQK